MHRIEAELLIPGHGGPIRDGVVVLDGSRIGYAWPGRRGSAHSRGAGDPGGGGHAGDVGVPRAFPRHQDL